MRKPNLRKTLVLFSVYVVLTLSLAQMVLADEYCRELDIGPGPSEGDALIEYCTYPVEFKAMGKWGYFVYGYIPEGKEITLDIDEGPQLELENLQDPAAASHTTGSNEITVFESGAFLLFTSTSTDELELSTEDDDVYVSGTEECQILMQEKFITEQLIQLEAENEAGPTKMKLDIIADMLGLMGIYAMAVTGAPPGGGGNSCDIDGPPGGGGSGCDAGTPPEISGGGSGCDGGGPKEPPDGTTSCTTGGEGGGDGGGDEPPNPCISGGSEGEYPSFEIVEVVEKTDTTTKWRIKIKEGDLAGQEFIFESVKQPAAIDAASFTDTLYKTDGTKIAYREHYYGFISGQGTSMLMSLEDAVFEEFQGKGLTKIFNEYAFSKMLEAGMTSIETAPMMAMKQGANPFVAKSYKNMKFGPKWDIIGTLEAAEGFEIDIKDSEYFFDSQGRPYQYADMKVKGSGGAEIGDFFLFLEDASGKFLEGPEGEEVYKNIDTTLKPTEEVRTFLIDQETKGRTLWGKVAWEAKDMNFLKTSILDAIKWVGGKCPGKLGYYPAGGGDVSVFKLTDISKVVIVDSYEGFSTPDAVYGAITGMAANYGMEIRNAEYVNIESDKFRITFEYLSENTGAWEPKEIIFYNRNANTFFPQELKSGYDIYFERWFLNYDIESAIKAEVISNLKKDGIYLVAGRKDAAIPNANPEPVPSMIGLEEITRSYHLADHYPPQSTIPFQLCTKAEGLSEALLLDIFKKKIPYWAEETYEARAGKAASTVPTNLQSFDIRLNELEKGMEVIKTKYPDQMESLIIKLDDYLINKFKKSDMNPAFSSTQQELLLSETDSKFCDFAERLGFFGMCPAGGCARFPETFPESRESFHLRDPNTLEPIIDPLTNEPKNFIDTIEQKTLPKVRSTMAAEGIPGDVVIDVIGSNTYFYTLKDGTPVFRYEYVGDVDYSLIFSDDVPDSKYSDVANIVKEKLGPDMNDFYGRDVGTNIWFSEKMGNLKTLYGNNMALLLDQAYYGIYIGDGEMIAEIDTILAEVKEKATPEVLRTMLINLYDEAHGLAADGKYEKAVKRQIMMRHLMGNKQGTSDLVYLYILDHPNLEDAFKIYEPKIKAAIDAIGKEVCYKLGKFIKEKTAYDMKNSAGETKNFLDMMNDFVKRAKAEQGINTAVFVYGSSNYFFLTSEGKPNYIRIDDIDMFISPKEGEMYPDFSSKATAARNELIPKILQENGFVVGGSPDVPEFTLYEEGSPKTIKINAILTLNTHGSEHFIKDTYLREMYYTDWFTAVGDSETIDGINKAFEDYPETAELRETFRNHMIQKASNLLPLNPEKAAKWTALAARTVGTAESHAIADEIIIKFDEGTIDVAYVESKMAQIKGLTSSMGCYKLSRSLTAKEAFNIKNSGGVEYNLLEILEAARVKANSELSTEGTVGIRGSLSYFYESEGSKINWKYVKDLDVIAFDMADDVPFLKHLYDIFKSRGFDPQYDNPFIPQLFSFEVYADGVVKRINIDSTGSPPMDWVFADYIKYDPHGMTFLGDSGEIDLLIESLESIELSAETKESMRDVRVERAKNIVSDYADYEHAYRRLVEAVWVMDNYELRDEMYVKFVEEFEGAKDFKTLYETWLPTVEALKVSGLCYKLSKSYTTKDAYIIENTAGQKHNMLDIMYEALRVAQETTGEEGAVAIKGSSQYLYESPEKINWKYPRDVDMVVIDVSDNEFLARVVEEFTKRNFEVLPGDPAEGFDFAVKVKEGGETVIINLDRIGETKNEVFDPARVKDSYPEDMTFVGDSDQIADLVSRVEELKSAARAELRHGYLVTDANNWAFAEYFEKASKRLIEAAWIVEAYELRDEMYLEFVKEFEGAKDFKAFYEKYYPLVDALKPYSKMKIDSTKKQQKYYRLMNDYTDEMSEALKNLDAAKADEKITKLNTLKADIGADTILIEDDRAGLMEDIEDIKERFTKVKEALAVATDLDALEDDAVRAKVKEAKEAIMMGRMDLTEDATSLYEKVGQELITVKEDFDALSEEKKATWKEKIAEKTSSLKSKLEAFIDFTKNIREKWHQSKYYKRVYEAMEWTHEKLGKLGKDRLATLGKATGVAMVGIGIVQILAEDIGGHWQIMGDNMNNPFYVMVGRRLETLATWIGVGFIAMIAVHILIAIVKGGLIAAILSLAMWLVLFVVLAIILTTGLKYFWCDYMNKSLAGDPICMIFYGPAPIAMTASIQGTSGTCTMAGTWDGQSEMNCN